MKSKFLAPAIFLALPVFSLVFTNGPSLAAQSDEPRGKQRLSRLVERFVNASAKAPQQDQQVPPGDEDPVPPGNEDEEVQRGDNEDQLTLEALESRPFEPSDRNLFTPPIYPETPELVPASGPAPTEERVARLLQEYLAKDWTDAERPQKLALAIFGDPSVKKKIPDPSLRAALLGLGRTVAVDAIPFILFAETPGGLPLVKEVQFGEQNQFTEDAVAVSRLESTTEQLTLIFNPKYRGENPFLFSRVLAHEALHSDSETGDFEEVVARAIDSFVILQQLSRHPELAALGTELARRYNSDAFARVNAGEGQRLGNVTNNDRALFPGSPLLFTEWLDQFQNLQNFVPTPGNELLGNYLSRLQERETEQCSPDEFNEALLGCVLENQRGLTRTQLVAAANAIKLYTGVETPENGADTPPQDGLEPPEGEITPPQDALEPPLSGVEPPQGELETPEGRLQPPRGGRAPQQPTPETPQGGRVPQQPARETPQGEQTPEQNLNQEIDAPGSLRLEFVP